MSKALPRPEHPSRLLLRPGGRRNRAVQAGSGPRSALSPQALRARRKFLRAFPGGFRDETYLDWERGYKSDAHARWQAALNQASFQSLIKARKFEQIASTAIRVESLTNLLFSFEKMALRDAVRSAAGAKTFALALFDLLHGSAALDERFSNWVDAIERLPRRQTRVLTWPLVTVFGFLAQPEAHFFLKPMVTREAARRYGLDFHYAPRPSWPLYKGVLDFVARVRADIRDLRPRDMIDMQSFLWVQGSDEYPD